MTLEDVANSLYYVHLDAPSDEHLRAPAAIQDPSSPSSRASLESNRGSRPPIQRKPLPPNAQVAKRDGQVSVPAREWTTPSRQQPSREAFAPTVFAAEDDPASDAVADRPRLPPRRPDEDSPQASAYIQRKPLGPRPMDVRSTPETQPASYRTDASRMGPTRPLTPPRPHGVSRGSAPLAGLRTDQEGHRSPSSHEPVPFALSLIRRDPTSGNQWNIGRVSSFQANEGAAAGKSHPDHAHNVTPSSREQPAIDICLETSGYAKFRGFPARQSVDPNRPPSMTPLPHSGTRPSSEENLARNVAEGFSRRVVMSYTKSWTANIKDAFRRSDRSHQDNSEPGDAPFDLEPPTRPGMRARQDSAHSFASQDSGASIEGREARESPPTITAPGPGVRAKGYFFTSPWDGRCEFRTGNGGRSLKCRHVLASNSAGFNPLVLAQGFRDGQPLRQGGKRGSMSSIVTGAMPVSELRFNLPSTDLFGKKQDSKDSHSRFDKLMGLDRRGSTSEDEDDPPFDISLGREHAGGGNRGKRAKLGKLIIHENGLKMLDLVVAANIGIWWGAWERRF